ncbi:mediator of RNA polymerase II transcription subunit 14 [Scheffersomyces xylosifermentans]|uniref:mediator of RNA polymerase II transcription subunit 14 n=1 Tax=Scheffersomyces xylosifermentans TaxID=1304137 RepID=UPI00315D1B61
MTMESSGNASNGSNGTYLKNINGTVAENSSVGSKKSTHAPPEIPHITNNIIPLSNVLKFYTQEAFKQITTLIENLSSTKDTADDSVRKKKFLELIISLRQDFIKIYTLVKWASNSKDVSKFIDLLNWLRMQEFYFEQLTFQLNALNGYSGAKLPNSDLITSLEVLFKGRPRLPSYNYIKIPQISAEKTLEVMQDLNLILMTRMALTDIPKRFVNNYTIKDGRIYFVVPNEFQVSITVANDFIIESDEEYAKSPFYFIDFKFLFGINPETSLITHRDNKIVTKLPKSSHENLEKTVNNVLLNQGLHGLYDLLHKYSISFKLYLIAKQLKDLQINTRWRNNLQVNYQNGRSLIILNYWSGQYLSRNWKSFIELGIDRNYNLNFRWFKNGKYNINEELSEVFNKHLKNSREEEYDENKALNESNEDAEEPEDLNVDLILNIIVNKHSELLMNKVFISLDAKLNTPENPDQVSYITPHQLLIKSSPTKSAIFCINPLTGHFYFIDPCPVQNLIAKKINSPPVVVKNKNFIAESDMVHNIVDSLTQLRLEISNKEIHNRLLTTEWINNDIINLSDYEINRLASFFNGSFSYSTSVNKLQFYRRKNWPSSWFLINLVSGITSVTYWWVARIKSTSGEWKIQWIQKLQLNNGTTASIDTEESGTTYEGVEPTNLNFHFFSSLSTVCSNMIIDHMILEELVNRNIKFLQVDKTQNILEKFNIESVPDDEDGTVQKENDSKEDIELGLNLDDVDQSSNEVKEKPLIYESIIMIYNDNNLLPIYNSSTSLFLKIKLINLNNVTQMKLKLFGKLRNLSIRNSPENFLQLNLRIDEVKNFFEIDDLINLSSRINNNGDIEVASTDSNNIGNNLLDKIFNNLNKLNKLIKILDQLNKNKIEIINNSVNDIIIKIDNNLDNLIIKLPEKAEDSIQLVAEDELKDKSHPEVKLILNYLNKYLSNYYSDDYLVEDVERPYEGENRKTSIVGIIKYLKEINPILKSVQTIKADLKLPENIFRLPNGMSKLNFDIKFTTLNLIQYVYHINYQTANSSKKIFKDKIVVNLTFKRNKFDRISKNLVKISLKDNLTNKNLKYKKLFELIFKSINEYDLEHQRQNQNESQVHTPASNNSSSNDAHTTLLIKLNYDFLVNSNDIGELMVRMSKCFLKFLQSETITS